MINKKEKKKGRARAVSNKNIREKTKDKLYINSLYAYYIISLYD